MILKSLEVDNFKILQFEKLEFTTGVTLIRGLNESGKSTILEAILFALYGSPLRPSRNAAHRFLIENSSNRARIALNFVVSGIEYRVSREIFDIKGKTSKAELWEVLPNGKLHPLETKWKGVNSGITTILGGVTYDEIVSSCVVAQKELGKLIDQNPGKRAQIINVFLNLNDFNETQKIMTERKKEILGPRGRGGVVDSEKTTLDNLNEKLDEFDNKTSKKEEKKQELTNTKQEFDVVRKEHTDVRRIRDLLNEYGKVSINERKIKDKIESYTEQLGIYKNQLDLLGETKNKIESEKDKLSELDYLSELELIISNLEETSTKTETFQGQVRDKGLQQEGITSRIEELRAEREKHKPSPDEEATLSAILPDMKLLKILLVPMVAFLIIGLIVNFFLLVPAGVIAVYIAIQIIRSNNLKVQKANAQGIHNEYMSLARLVEEKQGELDKIIDDLIQLTNKMQEQTRSISNIISEIPAQITSEIVSADLVESSIQIIKSFNDKCTERNLISESVKLMNEQLEQEPEILENISRLDKSASAEKTKLTKLVFPKLPNWQTFSDRLETEYNERTEELSTKVTELRGNVSNLKREIKELGEYLSENRDIPERHESQKIRVQEIRRELEIIILVIDAISETSKNLRERVRPSVEAHMQRILPLITAERYSAVQLSENYDVSVFDPSAGEFRQKEIFSGGTEDQFLLAARISFALALLPQGKETHPEFLFLDEPLGSSDEVRREGIMNLTKTVLGENFQQIFIISHVHGLEEWANQVIELDNGQVVS